MTSLQHTAAKRSAFTLFELAVVIVIIGVLAAFGVPRFLRSVERSKAGEAFAYLSAIQSAQERYQSQFGTYAADLSTLDTLLTSPAYFDLGTCVVTAEKSWKLTLTRKAGAAGYSTYTVTWSELASTVPARSQPRSARCLLAAAVDRLGLSELQGGWCFSRSICLPPILAERCL